MFRPNTPNICRGGRSAKSFCNGSIPNTINKKGKIDGWMDTGNLVWNWNIPNNAPLGKYKIKMMVFNESDDKPLHSIEGIFNIRNPQSPN
ncbi:MAG TPA: hypothetical protein VER14_04125 [Phototrophicaceae bacterium]|nr:hypothetical protein [Phototrophicaceae bacterium]